MDIITRKAHPDALARDIATEYVKEASSTNVRIMVVADKGQGMIVFMIDPGDDVEQHLQNHRAECLTYGCDPDYILKFGLPPTQCVA